MPRAMDVSRGEGGGGDLPLPSGERAHLKEAIFCVCNPPGYTKWSGIAC